MVVLYNILNVPVYNAFVLWTHIYQAWNSTQQNKRKIFIEERGRFNCQGAHWEERENPETLQPGSETYCPDLKKIVISFSNIQVTYKPFHYLCYSLQVILTKILCLKQRVCFWKEKKNIQIKKTQGPLTTKRLKPMF